MFSISGISVIYSGNTLFDNISFVINKRDRIGLVGKNGAGKTTLLNVISRIQEPHTGQLVFPEYATFGYLQQEMKHSGNDTVLVETNKAFAEARHLEKEIKTLNKQIAGHTDYESKAYMKLLDKLSHCIERLEYLDFRNSEGKVEKILTGLGFAKSDFEKRMDQLSGGWQMRVELAKILIQKPDLLLLDEPTNHLDIESILWFEDFLINFPGAVLLVSHDRMFLDKITHRTIELVNGRLYDYDLPYSRFVEARKERIDNQLAAARNQEQFIRTQERFIERFRAKNTKSKQVQSRIKKLEKIERVEVDENDAKEVSFSFPPAPRAGKLVIEAKGLKKYYGPQLVLNNLEFHIQRGERIAFVGKNGEGKTTLVKMLLREIEFEGQLKIGYNVTTGYYAQVQEATLDDKLTVFDTLRNIATGDWTKEAKLRGLLGAFLFRDDEVDKKVKVLSGGEKSRLALARLLLKPYNLLILDEPTNHLDISAKQVLKKALMEFDGTLILVSHDRDFLQGLTHRTFEFRNQGIKEHLGGIEDFLKNHKISSFRDFELSGSKNNKQGNNRREGPGSHSKESYHKRKEAEKERRKLTNRIKKTEDQIARLEDDIKILVGEMHRPDFYLDHKRAGEAAKQHASMQREMEMLLEKWEQLHKELGE